jgi:hypothetical protein
MESPLEKVKTAIYNYDIDALMAIHEDTPFDNMYPLVQQSDVYKYLVNMAIKEGKLKFILYFFNHTGIKMMAEHMYNELLCDKYTYTLSTGLDMCVYNIDNYSYSIGYEYELCKLIMNMCYDNDNLDLILKVSYLKPNIDILKNKIDCVEFCLKNHVEYEHDFVFGMMLQTKSFKHLDEFFECYHQFDNVTIYDLLKSRQSSDNEFFTVLEKILINNIHPPDYYIRIAIKEKWVPYLKLFVKYDVPVKKILSESHVVNNEFIDVINQLDINIFDVMKVKN